MNIDSLLPAAHWTVDNIGIDKLTEDVKIPQHSKKLIRVKTTAGKNDDEFVTCWTEGAKVTLHVSKKEMPGVCVIGKDPRTTVLDGWTYDNSRTNALKLLALIRWHKGTYTV